MRQLPAHSVTRNRIKRNEGSFAGFYSTHMSHGSSIILYVHLSISLSAFVCRHVWQQRAPRFTSSISSCSPQPAERTFNWSVTDVVIHVFVDGPLLSNAPADCVAIRLLFAATHAIETCSFERCNLGHDRVFGRQKIVKFIFVTWYHKYHKFRLIVYSLLFDLSR